MHLATASRLVQRGATQTERNKCITKHKKLNSNWQEAWPRSELNQGQQRSKKQRPPDFTSGALITWLRCLVKRRKWKVTECITPYPCKLFFNFYFVIDTLFISITQDYITMIYHIILYYVKLHNSHYLENKLHLTKLYYDTTHRHIDIRTRQKGQNLVASNQIEFFFVI